MKRRVLFLLLAVALQGCGPYARLSSMERTFEDQLVEGDWEKARETSRRMLEVSASEIGPSDQSWVDLRNKLSERWAWAGDRELGQTISDETLDTLERTRTPPDPDVASTLQSRAWSLFFARRWSESHALARQAASTCRAVVAAGADRFVCGSSILFGSSDLLAALGDPQGAAVEYLTWPSDYRLVDPSGELLPVATRIMGRWFAGQGQWAEALACLRHCVATSIGAYPRRAGDGTKWSSPSGDVTVSVIDGAHAFGSQEPTCLEDLIEAEREVGNEAEARRLQDWRRKLWSDGPDVEDSLLRFLAIADTAWGDGRLSAGRAFDLATYYAGKGRGNEAINAYLGAIRRLAAANLPDGRPGHLGQAALWIDIYFGIAREYEAKHRWSDAEGAYRMALPLPDRYFNPTDARRFTARAGLARALAAQSRLAEAEEAWRDYLAEASRVRGEDHADYATGLAGLADVLGRAGRTEEAAAATRRVSGIRQSYSRRIDEFEDLATFLPLPPPPSPAIQPPPQTANP